MDTAYLIMLRCASDDIPLFLFHEEQDARDVAGAITPVKAWGCIKASGWSSYSDPIAVVILTFRDGVCVDERQAIDCVSNGWRWPDEKSPAAPADAVPPFIRWMQDQGFRAQHMGGTSWAVVSDERPLDRE
jgi:hypothetical protein